MTTKINKFFELLEDLKVKYRNQFNNTSENDEEFTKEIESLYLTNKDLFPFDMKSAFENVRLEYEIIKTKAFFWDKLKDSYYNYEAFIDMDHDYLKSDLYEISDLNQQLFNHSRTLSANYFYLLAHDYYFHYGKNETRQNITYNVSLLNYYNQNPTKFEGLEGDKVIQILIDEYNYQYEKIEREIRYIYTDSDIILEIEPPEYIEGNALNSELEKLNMKYLSQLELLKDYKKNIKKFSTGLKFEFPEFINDNIICIRFDFPQVVYDSLEKYVSSSLYKEPLRKLIFGEVDISRPQIKFTCQSNKFSYFFGELAKHGITSETNHKEIARWIIQNFKYKSGQNFNSFSESSITTWMKSGKTLFDKIEYPDSLPQRSGNPLK